MRVLQKMDRLSMGAFLIVSLLVDPFSASATPWNLPQTISDKNTTVTFAVDSTWHLVEGKTSGLEGKVWLDDPSDPLSIRISVSVSVGRFDTDRESRDEKLRKVMHADVYPMVLFVGEKATSQGAMCEPGTLTPGAGCRMNIEGELRIGSVSKRVVLPVEATRTEQGFSVAGELSLQWAEYGVEDPSILIAKLDETVRVQVRVELSE